MEPWNNGVVYGTPLVFGAVIWCGLFLNSTHWNRVPSVS